VPRPHPFVYFCATAQQNATFWGVGTRVGSVTPKFELGQDLCTMYLAAKFHRSTFNRSEVIVLTNKQTNPQTDATEKIHLASLCYAGG